MDDAAESGLGSGRTRGREVRAEVLTGAERRRRWSTEEKLRILAQGVAPNSSASLTCRMHGISSGQSYTWRKQFRTGELTGFVPVSVMPDPPVAALPAGEPPSVVDRRFEGNEPASIEVELPSGIKLRLTGAVDAAALRQVISALA
ncbi:transposase [Lichenihabitans sp. Uapishka_5]|uniref:IS66-like element accessory protein TnpA n=1 Tax=Lichenihabitans sp. Uapishka_5 TaxID=3037302 RepID=UPI0029E7FC3D|nr:transposase [Lichenihabitans sp. Uapishka_5]MDX7953543.1 transposase [Lichenihabitans sp. Uapishka_5]